MSDFVRGIYQYGIDTLGSIFRRGLSEFINLYGKKLFRINNDRVIERTEKIGGQSIFYAYPLDLLPISQNIDQTSITIESGTITDLVVYVSDTTYNAHIDNIKLSIETDKVIDPDEHILEQSYIEDNDNDLLTAFREVKERLQKYIDQIHIQIDNIEITINNLLTINISDIQCCSKSSHISQLSISSLLLLEDINYENKSITIQSLKANSNEIELLPIIYLGKSDSSLQLDLAIYDITLDDCSIQSIILEKNRLSIDTIITDIFHIDSIDLTISDAIIFQERSTMTIHKISEIFDWIDAKKGIVSRLLSKVITDDSEDITISNLRCDIITDINLSVAIDTIKGSTLNGVMIVTDLWSASAHEICFDDEILITESDVIDLDHMYHWVKSLPSREGESKSIRLIHHRSVITMRDLYRSPKISLEISGVYHKKGTDIVASGFLNDHRIFETSIDEISEQSVITNLVVYLDPVLFDQIHMMLGTWKSDSSIKTMPISKLEQILSESMIVDEYTDIEQHIHAYVEPEKVRATIDKIIDDYCHKYLSPLFSVKIDKVLVNLYGKIDEDRFVEISIIDLAIKSHQSDLETSVVEIDRNVMTVTFGVNVTDLDAEGEWRRFLELQHFYADFCDDDGYRITTYCKPVVLNIREQCLLQLLSFISPCHCLPRGSSPSSIQYLSISEISLTLNYLPIIANNITSLSLHNHSLTLSPVKCEYCTFKEATDTVKASWFNSLEISRMITDIKMIKPYAEPIHNLYTLVKNYLSRSTNNSMLRRFLRQKDIKRSLKRMGVKICDLLI